MENKPTLLVWIHILATVCVIEFDCLVRRVRDKTLD